MNNVTLSHKKEEEKHLVNLISVAFETNVWTFFFFFKKTKNGLVFGLWVLLYESAHFV